MKTIAANVKKRDDPNNHKKTSEGLGGLGKIKKRIRDINRTLTKGVRTAQLKVDFERQLRALQYELGEKMIDEKERKMSTRYHKVKHFERKKIERKLKKATIELEKATSEENKQDLQKVVDDLKVDAMYIKHYPKTKKYISLFPGGNNANEPSSTEFQNALKKELLTIMETSNDFTEIESRFRTEYRESLTRRGLIPESKAGTEEDNKALSKDTKPDEFLELE